MTTQNMDVPRRSSLRLRDYDYAQEGAYFVTICTSQRQCILGKIVDDHVQMSAIGQIVCERWEDLPNHHDIELDAFVVMPNHVHGVIVIAGHETSRATPGETGLAPTTSNDGSRRGTLGTIVGSFKAATSRAAKEHGLSMTAPLWQRGYYEHIVRSDRALDRIRHYIVENPAKWVFDQENPARLR